MSTNYDLNKLHGWFTVDKPAGVSSFFIVSQLKKILGLPKSHKIGHGGTLDKLAVGVLPIALGEATKTVNYVMGAKKTYEFTIQFGFKTTTQDAEGEIVGSTSNIPKEKELINICSNFIGEILQSPSKFSAIKVNGRRAYNLARSGIDFEIKKRKINIYELNLIHFNKNTSQATFRAVVSKGTYIRSLAEDIAESLCSMGYVVYLRRSKIHLFKEKLLISLNTFYNRERVYDYLIDIEDMLDDILAYSVDISQAKEILNGNVSSLIISSDGIFKIVFHNKLLALVKGKSGCLEILRVFNHHKFIIQNKEKHRCHLVKKKSL